MTLGHRAVLAGRTRPVGFRSAVMGSDVGQVDQREATVRIVAAAQRGGRLGDHDLQRRPRDGVPQVTVARTAVTAAQDGVRVQPPAVAVLVAYEDSVSPSTPTECPRIACRAV